MASALDILENGYDSAVSYVTDVFSGATGTQIAVATAVGATIVGAGITAVALSGNGKKKKTGRRIKHTSRGWAQDRKRRSKQKWEIAYQKKKAKKKRKTRKSKKVRAKKRSRSNSTIKRVKYTKNGQPYIILRSGKARFIKRRKK